MIRVIIPIALVMVGCSTKSEEAYFKAVEATNVKYMKAYADTKQGGFNFDGTFNGKMSFVESREAPRLQKISMPKSNMDYALQAAAIVLPSVTAIAGFKYNSDNVQVQAEAQRDVAIAQSGDNADIFGSYGANFKNDSVNNSDLTSITTDSISDYSNSIDVSDTYTSTIQTVPTISVDTNSTNIN